MTSSINIGKNLRQLYDGYAKCKSFFFYRLSGEFFKVLINKVSKKKFL